MTNKIRVLEGLKPVQTRPEMYIGSTVNPQQLVVEVLDNALDELNNGYASEVHLNVFQDASVIVKDNGRGIPIHDVVLDSGEKVDSIIAAATILHSGAKFDNKSYGFRIGMHGVGLSVVNALSDYLHIEVKHDSIVRVYEFIETNLVKDETRKANPDDVSTLVSFRPSSKYFSNMSYNLNVIGDRLQLIAAHLNKSKIYFNDSLIEHIDMDRLVKMYLDIDVGAQLFKISAKSKTEAITVYLTYDDVKMIKGDVNLNICHGRYLNTFANAFAKMVSERYPSLTKANVLNGLKAYVSASIQDPRFNGQVKHEMVKDIGGLIRLLNLDIAGLLNRQFFIDHFKMIIEAKNMKLASKKLRRKTIVGVDNPLVDCEQSPGDVLYILEGDSAGGTVKQFRDVHREAIFPLSGKILNTVNRSIDEALDSKKVKFLLEAIGVDPGRKRKDFRYKEIKILTDADCDGNHIAVLVTLAIWKYAPEMIKEKRFKIILPPLYGVEAKNGFKPIYSEDELNEYKAKNYEIRRFKGLGEMNPSQLESVIRGNCREYIVLEPESDKVEQAIISCMTDTPFKREICNNYKNFGISTLMSST